LVGLLIQYFIGYEPVPVIIFVLIGIYDGSRRMWQISKKIEGK
jgi:F0F1-type ATP synthase assembly protein I